MPIFIMQKTVMLLQDCCNGMSQRIMLELQALGYLTYIHVATTAEGMLDDFNLVQPELVICPFLTKKVPAGIYKSGVPCIIVHPGIKGDRGMSSLDWAIQKGEAQWGVTLLSAIEEMDAGPIWSTKPFTVAPGSKSFTYRTAVIDTAVECLHETLSKFERGIAPDPVDYSDPSVRGRLLPAMPLAEQTIDWDLDDACTVLKKIRASDGAPGAVAWIAGSKFRVFNAVQERPQNKPQTIFTIYELARPAGSVLGHRHGSILVRTTDGFVWITHLKRAKKGIKLPAMSHFDPETFRLLPPPALLLLPGMERPATFQDIWVTTSHEGAVATLHFDFLNGAMSTPQLTRLLAAFEAVSRLESARVVVLRGGRDFFSNGINLNTIEASADPAAESVRNIDAINDLVRTIFSQTDKVTVTWLEGNAGAGGAMLPLACDVVLARSGVVLNPHYRTMGLGGSEYWTYFLTRRVGAVGARRLTAACVPVLARDMVGCGMVDAVVEDGQELQEELRGILDSAHEMIRIKREERTDVWFAHVEKHRRREMEGMMVDFNSTKYNEARRQFVYKIKAPQASCTMARTKKSHARKDSGYWDTIDAEMKEVQKLAEIQEVKEEMEKVVEYLHALTIGILA